jgi:hypothetical protein
MLERSLIATVKIHIFINGDGDPIAFDLEEWLKTVRLTSSTTLLVDVEIAIHSGIDAHPHYLNANDSVNWQYFTQCLEANTSVKVAGCDIVCKVDREVLCLKVVIA